MAESDFSEAWTLQESIRGCRIACDNDREIRSLDVDRERESKFFQSIKFLLNCCLGLGLFYKVNNSSDTKINKSMLYSSLMCVILAANVVRSLTVYHMEEVSDEILFFKIQLSVWFFESTVKTLVMFIYCYREDGFNEFFLKWNEYLNNIAPDVLTIRVMYISTVICWAFVIVNTLVIVLSFFLSEELATLFTTVSWYEPLDQSIVLVLKLGMTFVIFVNSAAAVFPIALLVVLSMAVIKQFDDFGAQFKSCIQPQGEFNGVLDEYRLRHQKMCTIVDILDRVFMIIIAIVFIADTVMFCIILYNLIYTTMPVSYRILNVFWLITMLLHIAIVSVVGAWLNVSVSMLHV